MSMCVLPKVQELLPTLSGNGSIWHEFMTRRLKLRVDPLKPRFHWQIPLYVNLFAIFFYRSVEWRTLPFGHSVLGGFNAIMQEEAGFINKNMSMKAVGLTGSQGIPGKESKHILNSEYDMLNNGARYR